MFYLLIPRYPHLQLVLLPVDDDGGDLLVHEEEDGQQQGGDGAQDVDIPRYIATVRSS